MEKIKKMTFRETRGDCIAIQIDFIDGKMESFRIYVCQKYIVSNLESDAFCQMATVDLAYATHLTTSNEYYADTRFAAERLDEVLKKVPKENLYLKLLRLFFKKVYKAYGDV